MTDATKKGKRETICSLGKMFWSDSPTAALVTHTRRQRGYIPVELMMIVELIMTAVLLLTLMLIACHPCVLFVGLEAVSRHLLGSHSSSSSHCGETKIIKLSTPKVAVVPEHCRADCKHVSHLISMYFAGVALSSVAYDCLRIGEDVFGSDSTGSVGCFVHATTETKKVHLGNMQLYIHQP